MGAGFGGVGPWRKDDRFFDGSEKNIMERSKVNPVLPL
jgi:hypothetical protein